MEGQADPPHPSVKIEAHGIRCGEDSKVWNRVTGSPVCTLNAKVPFKVFSKEGKPTLVTFGPNGKRTAVGYTNGSVLLWESDPMQAAEIWRNRRAGR